MLDSNKIPTDPEIIDLYWDRDEKAIYYTNLKFKNYLFTISYNILHNSSDCEECLNDTYMGAWNAIPPNRPKNFLVFLSKIIRNISISRYRSKTSYKRIPSEMMISLEELDECIGSNQLEENRDSEIISQSISSFLQKKPKQIQAIFICRYFCYDSIEKIAKTFQMSESSVYKKLASIRNGLKIYLKKEGIIV